VVEPLRIQGGAEELARRKGAMRGPAGLAPPLVRPLRATFFPRRRGRGKRADHGHPPLSRRRGRDAGGRGEKRRDAAAPAGAEIMRENSLSTTGHDRSARSSSLHIRGVCKSFGSFTALSDIDLDVASGEFVCFLGPSGCG